MNPTDTERELAAGFVAALEYVGLTPSIPRPLASDAGADFAIDDRTTGTTFIVECKPVATKRSLAQLEAADGDGYKVLASKRVSQELRRELSERGLGFYDERGHLRLHRPPLVIDTTVPGISPAAERRGRLRIAHGALLDVALAVLMGHASKGIRATAAHIDRAPGTVSKNLALLRDAGLVNRDNTAVIPELFRAVAEEWRPERFAVRQLPTTKPGAVADKLLLGLCPDDEYGWVLADHHCAGAWGAPVIVDSSSPPDFYVPSAHAASSARALLGAADFGRHACTIAVTPSPLVCRNRFHRAGAPSSQWPVPAPVIAALDLASDPGRGNEILQQWRPDEEEVTIVW